MRTAIELGEVGWFNWDLLRTEEHFLYRRVADRDRAVLAVGAVAFPARPDFDEAGSARDWVFGALRYEWKDVLFRGLGADSDHCHWTTPRFVVEWNGDRVTVHAFDHDLDHASIWSSQAFDPARSEGSSAWPPSWIPVTTKDQYLSHVERLLAHIQRGDIYEINYCTERLSDCPDFDPFASFPRLLDRSQAPFAAFYRRGPLFALCASPERFLAFDGGRVLGQPMKGTRARNSDPRLDRLAFEELSADAKERSENIMALDVMRHDLSRIAASRTVHVDELCAVRSYPRVHQMVSTVVAERRDGVDPYDVLRATFPMASMTGAPKFRAMQLIEEAEGKPRGLFSGSLGFFAPDGTGDFNVVIRTLLFNAGSGELSLTSGSAITALCDAMDEYAECEVKARSVIDALRHDR